MKIFCLETILE